MDEILAKASSQAVTFAIRSGISLASGFAIKTVTKFLDKIPDTERQRIILGRNKIQAKINILSVSIDLIKLASARGNSSLESTVELIESLGTEVDIFERSINDAIENISTTNQKEQVKHVEKMMSKLLEELNDAIPLINLSLITCGVSLNGTLPSSVSPGRLLQASDFVVKSNEKFGDDPVQVGPNFDLVLYSIFYNPSRLKFVENADELLSISWKEDFARSTGRIIRTKGDGPYHYKFEIKEDFNDGRYHEDEPRVKEYNLVDIKRLFFSASGKLLRLESRSSPVLICKISKDDLDEWVAFGEVGAHEFDESDDESESDDDEMVIEKHKSLSLLEYLVRLCALQVNESKSILDVNDERLALYLKDEHQNANQSIIPKSKKEIQVETAKLQKTNDIITLDSNISRLEKLDIKDSSKSNGKEPDST